MLLLFLLSLLLRAPNIDGDAKYYFLVLAVLASLDPWVLPLLASWDPWPDPENDLGEWVVCGVSALSSVELFSFGSWSRPSDSLGKQPINMDVNRIWTHNLEVCTAPALTIVLLERTWTNLNIIKSTNPNRPCYDVYLSYNLFASQQKTMDISLLRKYLQRNHMKLNYFERQYRVLEKQTWPK